MAGRFIRQTLISWRKKACDLRSGRLNDHCLTIAEALKGAGYFTAITGKWHVGQNFGVTPWGRGFDRSLNTAAGEN